MPCNALVYRLFLDPFAHGIACIVVSYLVAPAQFIKVIRQETGEPYSAIVSRHIRNRKLYCCYIGAHLYALRQSISSIAFGIAQWLCLLSHTYFSTNHLILLVTWECCVAGLIETIATAYSEAQEIAANKGALMKRKATANDILMPLLIRNIVTCSASILAHKLTKNDHSLLMNIVYSSLLGSAASALSMPFDLIATQNCGSETPMTWVRRLQQNLLVKNKWSMAFDGLTMRILQLIPFSIAHSLVMRFLEEFTNA